MNRAAPPRACRERSAANPNAAQTEPTASIEEPRA